ncbi:MAG: hypothetical protein M3391_11640 [Actinomycetota bacterium]|nr:hypothetical protein [Actinomycetota bacterium]
MDRLARVPWAQVGQHVGPSCSIAIVQTIAAVVCVPWAQVGQHVGFHLLSLAIA